MTLKGFDLSCFEYAFGAVGRAEATIDFCATFIAWDAGEATVVDFIAEAALAIVTGIGACVIGAVC